MNFKLISAETETQVDEYGETGGPDINLGKEFSKRFTWQDKRDDSYWTVTVTNYIRAVNHEGEDVEVDYEDDLINELKAWQDNREVESRKIQDRQYDGEKVWLFEELEKWEATTPQPIRYFWQTWVEYTQHSDPEDVGGSELTTEIDNEASSYQFFESKEDAEQDAKNDMDNYSPLSFNPEYF